MMNLLRFLFCFDFTLLKLIRPYGVKTVAAENIALRQQLILLGRNQKRSPKLTTSDRFIFGMLIALINPKRWLKIAIVIKPKTLLKFIRHYQWSQATTQNMEEPLLFDLFKKK